jgi:hypothetical protein
MLSSSTIIYLIAGAVIFSLLGVLATYYRNDKPTGKAIARDFAAGVFSVLFLKTLIPGFFPDLNVTLPPLPSIQQVMSRQTGGGSDYELQL